METGRDGPKRIETAANLTWPPTKEDLEQLYVEEHLSAMKISKEYGLVYPNPKSGEAMILYHLKRHGISRRDAAEHIRKVTEETVDEWVKRYEAGESLKQIAGEEVNSVTVFKHLRKRGLQLRDKVEAQIKAVTKHPKTQFTGNSLERTYLIGFSRGDCATQRHGRSIRVRTGTTHPSMIELFLETFGKYGFVREYLKPAILTRMEWNLEVDIDASFEFLLKNPMPIEDRWDKSSFLNFLAGFVDAEGCIYFHKREYSPSFEITIANTEVEIQRRIMKELQRYGYNPNLRCQKTRSPLNYDKQGSIWILHIWRHSEVLRLLRELPLRHPEKVRKAKLATDFAIAADAQSRTAILNEWQNHLENIELSVEILIRNAERLWKEKQNTP
jgi:hypothetical protein